MVELKKGKSPNAQQIYGYNGKILRADLSTGESTSQPVDADTLSIE